MTNIIIKCTIAIGLSLVCSIISCNNDELHQKKREVESYIISKTDTNYLKNVKYLPQITQYLKINKSIIKYFKPYNLLIDSSYSPIINSNIICYDSRDYDSNHYLRFFVFDTINRINSAIFSNGNFTFPNGLNSTFEAIGKGEATFESLKDDGFNHLNSFLYEKYSLGDTAIVESSNIIKFVQYLYSLYNYEIAEITNIDSLTNSFISFTNEIEDVSRRKVSKNAYLETNKFITVNKTDIKIFAIKKMSKNKKSPVIGRSSEMTDNICIIHFSKDVYFVNPAAKKNWFFDVYSIPAKFSWVMPIL